MGDTSTRNRRCVFTIATASYLPFVQALYESVTFNDPAADFVLIICDFPVVELGKKEFKVIPVDDLQITDLERWRLTYQTVEFCTAVKPFAFKFLCNDYLEVAYFDPDIVVYDDLSRLWNKLVGKNILLTPHITSSTNWGNTPADEHFLSCGAYNLGFIAVSLSIESKLFLDWWSKKVERMCVIEKGKGLFVDQKWMDLVPGMFSDVLIVREPSWNVAYWNIATRSIREAEGRYFVGDTPLFFFHFSGVGFVGSHLSKYSNPYTGKKLPKFVHDMVSLYRSKIINEKYKINIDSAEISSSHSVDNLLYSDITKRAARKMVFDSGLVSQSAINDNKLEHIVASELNRPIVEEREFSSITTKIAYQIYTDRPDLQQTFPGVPYRNDKAYSEWFIASAAEDYQVHEFFLRPILTASKISPHRRATDRERSQHIFTKKSTNGNKAWAYLRRIVRSNHLASVCLEPLVLPRLRHNIRRLIYKLF